MPATRFLAAAAAVAFLALPDAAVALRHGAPSSFPEVPEIPVSTVSERPARIDFTDTAHDPGLARFGARVGGRWIIDRDERTGSAHLVVGSGVRVAARLATAADARAAARALLPEIAQLAGVEEGDLTELDEKHGLGKWTVFFAQTSGGVRLENALLRVTMTEQGRLMAIGAEVDPEARVATNVPGLTADEAAAIAEREVGYDGDGDAILASELVVLPRELVTGREYDLAWRIVLRVDEPPGLWLNYVDAADGRILGRKSLLRMGSEVSGTVDAEVQFVGYCDGISDLPVKGMTVTIEGEGSDTTDAEGRWSIPVAASDSLTARARFAGPFADVQLQTMAGLDTSFYQARIAPGDSVRFFWTDDWARHDERDVFVNTMIVHDLVKELDPDFTDIDYPMVITVNRTDGVCPGNAWWDGAGMNFCAAQGIHANTGEIGSVVYHEYGHGVTQFLYAPLEAPDDLHEGNSDVLATYLNDTSVVGPGFYQDICSSGIRDLKNELRYPDDLEGEGHFDGQIIGGFHWDLRELLRTSYEEGIADSVAYDLWHFGRKLGRPMSQPDQVLWTFIADDDDGNLENGTPHYAAICTAASRHGFAAPALSGITIEHEPLASTTDPGRTHTVTAAVTSSAGSVDADSVALFYSVNGDPYVEIPMAPGASAGTYAAVIPYAPRDSEIAYYLRAVDDAGNPGTHPPMDPCDPDAVQETNRFDIAYVYDPAETGNGWTLGLPDDPATSGQWILADPIGTEAQPEDDHTPGAGTRCFVTGNGTPGGALDEADVDGGWTTLLSPVYDLTGATRATIKYFLWYTNDTGAHPGEDLWTVDLSNDGGGTWTTVEETSASEHAWREMRIEVTDFFATPGLVQLRFYATDAGGQSVVEAAVDDLDLLTDLTAPVPFDLLYPADGDTVRVLPIPFRWQALGPPARGGATTYTLLLSSGAEPAPYDSVAGITDTTYAWDGATDDTELRWWVRAETTDGASVASRDTASFVTAIPDTPSAFTLLAPGDGMQVATLRPAFRWWRATDPDPGDEIAYTVLWSTDPTFATADSAAAGADTSLAPASALLPDTTYVWRVRARDSFGLSRWATPEEGWTFRTPPPYGFTLLSPADGDTVWESAAAFRWGAAESADPAHGFSYTLYLSSDPGLAVRDSVAGLPDTTYSWSALADDASYRWWVVLRDSTGNGFASRDTFSFATYLPEAPGAFSLSAPPNGVSLDSLPAELRWTRAVDPDPGEVPLYTVYWSADPAFTSADSVTGVADSALVLPAGLLPATTYSWRVRAEDRFGLDRWADPETGWSFRTPAPADVTAPALVLAILQNPYLTSRLVLVLAASEPIASPTVLVGGSSTPTDMALADTTENVWLGRYELTSGGSLLVTAEAADLAGNVAEASATLGVGRILAAAGGTVTSADGRVALAIDAGVLSRDAWLVIARAADAAPTAVLLPDGAFALAPAGARDTAAATEYVIGPPGVLGRPARLSMSIAPAGETSIDRFTIARADGDPLECFADPDAGEISAWINDLGRFRLAEGAPGSSRILDRAYLALLPAVPNPTRGGAAVEFEIRYPQRVVLRIFDVRGRAVASLLDAETTPGTHRVRWNGRDGDGREVASGTYLYRLTTERTSAGGKIVVLR